MNATRVLAAAGVVHAAMEQGRRTAAGIAAALEAAGLLMSPEKAAELTALQARVAEAVPTVARLEQKRVELERIANAERARVAELEAERSELNEMVRAVNAKAVDAFARVAELEAAPLMVHRASHDSIVMGRYTTAAEARKHCESVLRHEYDASTKVSLWWREDEDTVDQPEDGEAELFAHVTPAGMSPGRTWRTGYVVTPLEVASECDPDAEE
ncbi:hypothetical protein ACFRKB_11185 [Streptomyces scopuliridis]|uniref:hypothetical protein n=1 Tax=Streptomyces scopuliridis TaxID=452529 RepID=UPI0036B4E47F